MTGTELLVQRLRRRERAYRRALAVLSAKRQRFVVEYLVDGNGTKAARRAGYSSRGPAETAYRLRKHPEVAAAIALGLEAKRDWGAVRGW